MLSWLGEDYYYDFPHKQTLVVKLKDVLEPSVDEKYYLSEKTIRAGKRVWLTPLQKRAELMEDYLKSGFKDENDKEIKIRFLKKSA